MYTVKFLDNEAFDNLPYKGVSTAVGVADRNSNIAYVRDTGNPMDIFTAHHELEHLKGDDLGEHESPGEDGIYYKKMNWLIPAGIAAAIFAPQILPGLFGGGGAAAGAGYAANAGAVGGSMGLGIGTGTAAGSAAASGAAGIGGAGLGGALSSLGKGAAQGIGTNLATNAIGGIMGGSPTKDAMNQFQMPQMAPSVSNPSTQSQSPAVSAVGGQGGSDAGGGLGAGTIDKVRQLMQQRQSGFYAGRDASGGF